MAEEISTAEDDGVAPASVAITIQLAVLAVAFVIGRALERIRFQWMGEAGAALLLGLGVGLILKAAGVGHELAAAVAFKGNIFFYILLPTIMFDAGYSLDTRMFIKNVGALSLYAFAGTTISCFVVGLIMWAFGQWGWCYSMPLLANLIFGALISATDPVTVLAVFQRLNAQPDLYMNVFGESVLNDAVGLVLYNVIASFADGGKAVTAGSVFGGIGLFIGIFVGSTAIGIVIGLLAAFIFRSRYFYSGPVVIHGSSDPGSTHPTEVQSGSNSTFEVGLAVVFAYGSYLVADVAHCSGIVAVVVNGMVMNMYVRPNLSTEAAHKIETLFKTLGGLFELFVFCYIGTTMFLQDEKYNIFNYTVLSLLALAVSRAANILPLTALVNLLRPVERHIPPSAQFMLWWSGLRGAMAFALSVEADDRFGEYGRVMKTCTFYLIFITVLFNGGTSAYLIRRLKLRAEDTPAPLLRNQDCLAHMHGFGRDDVDMGAEEAAGEGGSEEAEFTDRFNGGVSPTTPGERRRLGKRREEGKEAAGADEEEGRQLWGRSGSGSGGDGGGSGGGSDDGGDRLAALQQEAQADGKQGARRNGRSFRSGGGGSFRGLRSGGLGSGLGSGGSGGGSSPSSRHRSLSLSLASPSALLQKVRSLNDGRLVERFDEFDRRVSKLLIHPDARREAEMTPGSHASFRTGLSASQHGGLGAVGAVMGSHEAPQTLDPPSPPLPPATSVAATRTHVAVDVTRATATATATAAAAAAAAGGKGSSGAVVQVATVAGAVAAGPAVGGAAAAESGWQHGTSAWALTTAGSGGLSEVPTHGSVPGGFHTGPPPPQQLLPAAAGAVADGGAGAAAAAKPSSAH
ncbi:hypothetical protein PLESTF_000318100 [Pleodorina starrii]|nr:hypothetical protein PLESTM_000687800 [Pleodorina starrii]GLC65608.1 hypothetical protein PLESTF_000318100 [Pleodorina starrii]